MPTPSARSWKIAALLVVLAALSLVVYVARSPDESYWLRRHVTRPIRGERAEPHPPFAPYSRPTTAP
jgi:hypothetical protein